MTSADALDLKQEDSRRVLSERRLRMLRELAMRTAGASSVECACQLAASAMQDNTADLPFTLLYVLEGSVARLAAATGIQPDHAIGRRLLDLTDGASEPLPIAEAVRTSEAKVVDNLDALFPELRARKAWVLPIGLPRASRPLALMVAGVSPRAELDDHYASFLDFLVSQVIAAIASAGALEQASGKLREAAALRDEFLTLVSHELRTPLTTLGMQADSLLHALKQTRPDDPTAQLCLPRAEKLRAQARRLEQLIEGLLDVFALGREGVPLSREELDLSEVARVIVARLRNESTRASATIHFRGERTMGTWDREHLEQILTQLISNGVKFGAGQPVDVSIDGDSATARISVKDRGIGVEAEAHEQIFGRFVRVAPSSQYGGLGLGLWMVRALAEAMGGSVRVESRAGEGAEFIVELPRNG